MQQNWFYQNKVVIVGLLTAVLLAVQEAMKAGESSIKVFVFAGILAAISFLANNLRGQVATIIGIVGTAISTYVTMDQTGSVSWSQIVLQTMLALLAVFAPPAKSKGYEYTQTIQQAKTQGERIKPSTGSK
jgi:hypothetical protein